MACPIPSSGGIRASIRVEGTCRPVSPHVRAQSCANVAQLGCRPRFEPRPNLSLCRYSDDGSASRFADDAPPPLKHMRVLEGAVDDPLLANPLRRLDRLGTSWFGVVFEDEGVLIESAHNDHVAAWRQVCADEGVPAPHFALQRAAAMKSDQAVSEVLCLSKNPDVIRRLAAAKEEAFDQLQEGRTVCAMPGAERLLQLLASHEVPVAVVSNAPRERLMEGLQRAGLAQYIVTIVAGDVVSRGRPDPEPYHFAAMALERPPLRCVLVGASNLSIEGARDVGMACIAVASTYKMYELTAADMVVRELGGLTMQNLKQLFGSEEGREPELQAEEQVHEREQAVAVAEYDGFGGFR